MISENLAKIKDKILQATDKSGRKSDQVKLIAVSKRQELDKIIEANQAGQMIFGENQVQEVLEKSEKLEDKKIEWHLIGSLQTNKVKYITRFCSLFHALDRLKLAKALHKRLEFENKYLDCLVQINISGEDSKSGFNPKEIFEIIPQISEYNRLNIRGIMTIAENSDDENAIRDNFKRSKEIFEELKQKKYPQNISMKELSMGMSGDYEIAIEEGSTMIRVGSAIFGEREY
jgi:hypothetical protein